MLKALIRKQFLELNSFYFQDRKTGKRRSRKGIIGYTLLYIFLLLGLGFAFYELASMMASAMIPAGYAWLFYAFMGMLAIFFGVFGGVFNTYASLYLAKDNELLIAMPVPPSYILLSRMLGVFAMSFMYEALVFIPTAAAYFVNAGFSVSAFAGAVLTLLLTGLLCTVLCCIFGWVIALISTKVKNKSFITVVVSLVFFVAYYMFCGNYYMLIQELIMNMDIVGSAIKGKAYPLYVFGSAAAGNWLSLLIFAVFVLAAIALTAAVLSRSFSKITSMRGSRTKAVYKENSVRASGMEKTLFMRELKRYTSSAVYMLNCSLGTVIMPAAGIAALFFLNEVRDVLGIFASAGNGFEIALMLCGICTCLSMNDITAPSISLEGKNLWIVQSMPVSPLKVFEAKKRLHYVITLPSALILTGAVCIVLQTNIVDTLLIFAFTAALVMFNASLGLVLNLKMPSLNWTNEAVPIKQSLPVMICLFGGWLLAVVIALSAYYALYLMSVTEYITVWLVILCLAVRLLNRWLAKRGSEIFEQL